MENLRAEVDSLKTRLPPPDVVEKDALASRQSVPTERGPVNIAELAEWVDSLMVRYASTGDWLRPCWWRHGFVIEELAALRIAWLAVFDAETPADPTAGVRWHEEAERCRERIRRTISVGPGCSAVSHRPDQPITDDPRWAEEQAVLHREVVPWQIQVGSGRGPFTSHLSGGAVAAAAACPTPDASPGEA